MSDRLHTRRKLQEVIEIQNPYPESVWPEIEDGVWQKIDVLLKENLGVRIDRVSASLMRRAWELYRGEVKQILESED